ncbi:MAG: transthyretin-like family protein [Candidatus Bathyarchaeota archaeon]|nr:transthyretin-like family protein [Candidatus Bathyarchaeota archaeon]
MNVPPSTAALGSTVTFNGRLVEAATENPVPAATIKIMENDMEKDDLLASGFTETDGSFSIEWKAEKKDWLDNTVEIYAKFEGNAACRQSETKKYTVTLTESHETKE